MVLQGSTDTAEALSALAGSHDGASELFLYLNKLGVSGAGLLEVRPAPAQLRRQCAVPSGPVLHLEGKRRGSSMHAPMITALLCCTCSAMCAERGRYS